MPPDDPAAMASLIHRVRSYGIEGYNVDGANFAAWTTIGSEGNAIGYYLREQGLYAANPKAPDDRSMDILYAVSVVIPSGNGRDYFAYIPAANSASVVGWRLQMNTLVAGTANVEVVVGPPTDYVTLIDLEAYTHLSMFRPENRNGIIYGRHPHRMEDVDGLVAALEDLGRRFGLLWEMVANNVTGLSTEFRVTFWTLDNIKVNEGQWDANTGRMIA